MTRVRFAIIATAATVAILCLCWLFWHSRSKVSVPASSSLAADLGPVSVTGTPSADDFAPTSLYAHNLLLRKGPDFRIYIRWIRGQMVRTRRQVNPSSDDRESFVLQIQKSVIHANIGDISNYLYASSPANAPLKNISLQPEGDQLKLHGTVYKIVSFPIELVGTLSPTPDGRVQFQFPSSNARIYQRQHLLHQLRTQGSSLIAIVEQRIYKDLSQFTSALTSRRVLCAILCAALDDLLQY
ncbi:MAG: hypothetical protein JWQ42_3678 [Edaphobacter sp.]|nr:hypothetical protein [Edaphobacter sp.]